MLDEHLAQDLQAQHLAGEPRAIVKLYAECIHLGGILARKMGSTDDEVVHVAVSRILRRYHNGFRVKSFAKLLGLEITHELKAWDRGPKRAFLQSVGPLEECEASPAPPENPQGREVLEALFAEPNGRRIFFDLALYATYRDAIISISAYVTPDRIVTESAKLRDIHRVLHSRGIRRVAAEGKVNGAAQSNGEHRRGSMDRDKEADSRHKHGSTPRKQTNSVKGHR